MLDSVEAVRNFFGVHYPLCVACITSISSLSGGFVNYVFRVSFNQEVTIGDSKYESVIVKSTPPHFAGMGPDFPFSQDRLKYEVQALTEIPKLYPKIFENKKIGVPNVIAHFETDHTMLMQDLGSLESLFTAPQHLSVETGRLMGSFSSFLHSLTKDTKRLQRFRNNESPNVVYSFVYEPLGALLKDNGVENWKEIFQEAKETWRALYDPTAEQVSVIMGDFWPASLLVQPGDSGVEKIWVIDWEFSNLGSPILDISYLLAVIYAQSLFIQQYREGALAFIASFVDSYSHINLRNYISTYPFFSIHFAVSLINEAINTRWCKCSPQTKMKVCPCTNELYQQGLSILKNHDHLFHLLHLNK